MKKIIPIVIIGIVVLGGLGAVAVPETKQNTLEKKEEGMGIGMLDMINLNYVADMPALLACPPYHTSI